MKIGVLGINHKLADLKLREVFAKICSRRFTTGSALHHGIAHVLLSTCNRTEIYFSSEDLAATQSYLLNILKNEIEQEFEHKLYSYFLKDCFSHLARVTSGLDSAIVGETEIQGQVKIAYECAAYNLTLPHELHFLFQKALKIGKDIREKLQIGRGMPDLEHSILTIGTHFFQNTSHSKVLFIGTSDINHKILKFFQQKGLHNLTVCNRTTAAAEKIAEEYCTAILPWSSLPKWHEFDWIIMGTKAPDYLLKREHISEVSISQKLLIDLSVPRNVDPRLSKNQGITLLNIDQINRTLKFRQQRMTQAIHLAENAIHEATSKQVHLFSEKERKRLHRFALCS